MNQMIKTGKQTTVQDIENAFSSLVRFKVGDKVYICKETPSKVNYYKRTIKAIRVGIYKEGPHKVLSALYLVKNEWHNATTFWNRRRNAYIWYRHFREFETNQKEFNKLVNLDEQNKDYLFESH